MSAQAEFILETWNGKTYEPEARGSRRELEPVFERLRGGRRIVRADKARPAKPRYRVPHSSSRGAAYLGYKPFTPNRPPYDKWAVEAYLEWARAKGLKQVTVYADGKGNAQPYAKAMGFEVRTVALADFLGDAPAPEVDE